MSKILLGFVFFTTLLLNSVYSAEEGRYGHRFFLKKDELAYVIVREPNQDVKRPKESKIDKQHLLKIHWTLFSNDQLFVLANYDGHPSQFIMKKADPLRKVRLTLVPDKENRVDTQVNAYIFFNDFDDKKQQTLLDVVIEDKQERVRVEFKPKK